MKTGFGIVVVSLLAVVAVSCSTAKVEVLEAEDPYFNGLTSVHTRATVCNSSRRDITVENATMFFYYKERELATAGLMLPVTVEAGATERVRIDMKLESGSLANLQALQRRAQTNPDRLTVSVRARIRWGKTRRTVELKDVRYSAIIANFGDIIR